MMASWSYAQVSAYIAIELGKQWFSCSWIIKCSTHDDEN